ncbi:MAG: sarcosine oxidase subunit gamma family protein [Pseudomonadota bacterium]
MSDLVVTRRLQLRQFNLRGDAADEEFVAGITNAIRTTLPTVPNTVSSSATEAYWLGPDEWQIIIPEAQADRIVAAVHEVIEARHAAFNDISGGQVALQLAGSRATEMLAKGCTIDFHSAVFAVGDCAQTGLGKAPVLIARRTEAPVFDIVVRSSFAGYLNQWLQQAGSELGIEFR